MTTPKVSQEKNEGQEVESKEKILKSCFIIMPIADVPGYDSGHFNRVYNHIIKPACELSGFAPIRADDINSSNMIVVDILKKIIESDLAICDLSGRNPNVLYELGLRQAFNKKTVLIKDNKTENIFDVQGFRYTQYDSSLRIDHVKNEINKFSSALKETYQARGDINSIVQLLQIEPAKIDSKTELTPSDTVLFRAINDIKKTMEQILSDSKKDDIEEFISDANAMHLNGTRFQVGDYYFNANDGNELGKLVEIDLNNDFFTFLKVLPSGTKEKRRIPFSSSILSNINSIPF